MSGKKILMLTGDFSEEYEIFVFEQAMMAVGHQVDVVCPDKNAGEILKTSLHDFEGDKTYTEKLGHNFPLKKSFSKVKPADYDAVYVAGGRGPEYIRIDKRVQEIIRHFHKNDKPIFTICHGVQVLMAVPETIRGKEVAALQYCEPEVTAVGGKYIDVPPDRRTCGRQARLGKGLAGPRGLHEVLPAGARHRDPARRDCSGESGSEAQARDCGLTPTRSPASGWGTGVGLSSARSALYSSPNPLPTSGRGHSIG